MANENKKKIIEYKRIDRKYLATQLFIIIPSSACNDENCVGVHISTTITITTTIGRTLVDTKASLHLYHLFPGRNK